MFRAMPKNQQNVDNLVKHFWKSGYITLSRRFGTYLPEPRRVGDYDVEAIGKYKKKYAIGIILTADELEDTKIYTKLDFLASRNTKYSNKRVTLFIGVPKDSLNKAQLIISSMNEETKKNIKLVALEDKN